MAKKVMVAVLNWGLGHAGRSVPIINELLSQNAEVVITSNGDALKFLQSRFPALPCLEIPDKEIKYGASGAGMALLRRALQQRNINRKQRLWIWQKIEELNISHLISDNIYGAYSHKIPSALITHQLGIWSPFFKAILDRELAKWLNKFQEVWIPDEPEFSIAGQLLHNVYYKRKPHYIGHLSRFERPANLVIKDFDFIAVLSGPEPQRTFLEKKILLLFAAHEGPCILVRGKMNGTAIAAPENTVVFPYLHEEKLQELILRSSKLICRSGYSSILDLIRLGSSALLVPTPQQPEQKYLAKRMLEAKHFEMCYQKDLLKYPLVKKSKFNSGVKSPSYENSLRPVITDFLR